MQESHTFGHNSVVTVVHALKYELNDFYEIGSQLFVAL